MPRAFVIRVIAGVWLAASSAAASSAAATSIVIPNPPEPSPDAIYAAAGVDPNDPQDLWQATLHLLRRHPGAIDVWLPDLRTREHAEVSRKFSAEWMRRREAEPGKWGMLPPPGIIEPLVAAMVAQRPHDPARQVDLFLRRLGEVGTAEQFPLGFATFAQTPWGRWKAYAAAQDIMARSDAAELLPEVRRRGNAEWAILAMLAADLEPEVAGAFASAIQAQIRAAPHGAPEVAEPTKVWLAWAMARADPAAAADLFTQVLQSDDPVLRLAAGSGLMTLSRSAPPFRLTASREETQEQREAWLAGIEPQSPDTYWRSDPFSTPLVQWRQGPRADFIWLNHQGEVVRRIASPLPPPVLVLPDGTYWSRLPNYGHGTIGLVSPSGEVYGRFFDTGYLRFQALHHGGLLAPVPWPRDAVLAEYAPWGGQAVWAVPHSGTAMSVAGPGRFVFGNERGVHLIDRRGDVIWSWPVELPDDLGSRHVELVGPHTLLVAGKERIELHDLREGLLHRFEGFRSILQIRYQHEGPWIIMDSGSAVVLHPETGERFNIDRMP